MALAQRTGRSRRQLILLVLSAITLLTLDLGSFGPLGSAQRLFRDFLHPVTNVAGAVATPFADAWNAVFDYSDLQADYAELEAERNELKGQALSVEAERAAFQRLLDATQITYVTAVDKQAATVVRGAVGNFDSDVITIDKGSQSGIETGMAVVTAAGLVGRIDRVDATTATVQLLSDQNLIIGVRMTSTEQVGLGHTDKSDPLIFEIDQGLDWPEDNDLSLLPKVGSVVVTAASSRYPAEIPIGRVIESVNPDGEGLSLTVRVEMANDVTNLGYVTVLLAPGVDQVPLGPVVPSTSVPLDIVENDGAGQ